MAFWVEVFAEAAKFVFLVLVAAAGVFAGIALRKNKDKKEAQTASENQ